MRKLFLSIFAIYGMRVFAQAPMEYSNYEKPVPINSESFQIVDFDENYSNLYTLYDFRDKTGIGHGIVCAQHGLQGIQMLKTTTNKTFLFVNPLVKVNLDGICKNKAGYISIPIEGNKFYPYFYNVDNDFAFVNGQKCRKLYIIDNNGVEINTKGCVIVDNTNKRIKISMTAVSIFNLANTINSTSKQDTIKSKILCKRNDTDGYIDILSNKWYDTEGNIENIDTTHPLFGNSQTTCMWYK